MAKEQYAEVKEIRTKRASAKLDVSWQITLQHVDLTNIPYKHCQRVNDLICLSFTQPVVKRYCQYETKNTTKQRTIYKFN